MRIALGLILVVLAVVVLPWDLVAPMGAGVVVGTLLGILHCERSRHSTIHDEAYRVGYDRGESEGAREGARRSSAARRERDAWRMEREWSAEREDDRSAGSS